MSAVPAVDPHGFRRILYRNIALPLIVGVISVLGFVALIAYLLSTMNQVERSDRVIAESHAAAKLAVDQETGMRGFLLSGNESFLEPYRLGKPRMQAQLDALEQLVGDDGGQVQRIRLIKSLHDQWTVFVEEVLAQRRTNGDWLRLVMSGRGKQEFDQLRREFDAFLKIEEERRQARGEEARRVTAITVTVYLVLSLLLAGGLALFGRRELLRLSESYNAALSHQGEHGRLLEHQAWLRAGQTRLAERIVGQPALAPLARGVLDFLAEYLGMSVGALYVREPGNALRRSASYGFSKESEASPQLIAAGEGLVGQAALAKRVIRLDSVPENYLKISSGMGSGSPVALLLAPIQEGGVVNGVMELGFARPVEARDLELLELVAPAVGAAIEAALYRQRLQAALADTQQLNEELQVQQEELRTANEGLEEQSRLLRESQASLENQQAELEQTNVRLNEQAVSLDQKNHALRQAQEALEARADDLQRASRYKSEFLANMSHELRTPLNSSLILAKLLAENKAGNLNAEQIKFAESIYASGNDLLALINDILDISKVEAGQMSLQPEAITVDELVGSLERTFLPLAEEKHLAFRVQQQEAGAAPLYTDRMRLEQILKNLLSNAIKFTEHGSVTLSLSTLPGERIVFAVKDSGIGIEPEQQDAIFEAFRQADGGTSRRYGGTGLGLSISRELAGLLGGEIAVSSTPGQGSTFTLTMPRRIAQPEPQAAQVVPHAPQAVAAIALPTVERMRPAAPAPAPAAPSSQPVAAGPAQPFPDDRAAAPDERRAVLVVEDEPAFAGILYDLAREMGYRCLVAQGADEGLQLARQFLPSAVLLDMRLPDRPGLSLLQQLKEDPATRHIPVHVVSSEDRSEAALHMGAIGYAQKPASREELREVFQRLEERYTRKMKHILLVEDDARQRDSVTHLISDEDVEITAVATGAEALALLGQTQFDCMIIDLKLPDMQGRELLRRMSQQGLQPFPPVIVYTGRNLTREEEADLMKYSRSIIIKGARSPERLLDEVTLFLHKVESELSVERQAMLKSARSRDHVFQGRRILLVDDDVRNIFALTSALEQKGLAVEIARNGEEAIAKLDAAPDVDLVLMDVMMPVMDGLEATRRIRTDARFAKLPIIAVTAKAMRDDHEQCLRAGASDYLAKPIDLDRLFSLLRVWLPNLERLPS
ncbi:response regulator [Noviherbaspirillum soli]|uniref:response regulator n=1 Tax=Noviherbaspirillum soli TaxID=1064518 RepID=UPI00188A5542|nr:response regulator [Noviherbaspirillum soli]